eukprot:Amastigsp_a680396_32.p3 type:complete len:161 gc:universal Amastigsp_a680396_32:1275-793(-)
MPSERHFLSRSLLVPVMMWFRLWRSSARPFGSRPASRVASRWLPWRSSPWATSFRARSSRPCRPLPKQARGQMRSRMRPRTRNATSEALSTSPRCRFRPCARTSAANRTASPRRTASTSTPSLRPRCVRLQHRLLTERSRSTRLASKSSKSSSARCSTPS